MNNTFLFKEEKMIKSCVFNDDLSDDFKTSLEMAENFGIEFVKLRNVNGHKIGETSYEEINEMKAVLKDSPIKIGCIGSPVFAKGCLLNDDETYNKQRKVFEKMLLLCEEFSVGSIRMFSFNKPDSKMNEHILDDNIDEIVKKLKEPVRMAERSGVTLLFETEWKTYTGTAEEAAKLLEALNSKAVKVCWDVMNAWSAGEIAFPDGYKYIKDNIGHVHVKDCTIDSETKRVVGERVIIGQGDIPWQEIFITLNRDGYEGLATAERKFAPQTAENSPEAMDKIKGDIEGLFNILKSVKENS